MFKSLLGFENLKSYFTNMEDLLSLFKGYVGSPYSAKRVLIVHGVGGVGKTTLLRMFHFHCERDSVPVATAWGNEIGSVIDILSAWAEDLKAHKVRLKSFDKHLKRYRAAQGEVEKQVQKAREMRDQALDKASKSVAKAVIDSAVSAIPIIGPAAGAFSGVAPDTVVDWMRGFLSRPDVELLLNPTKKLKDVFLKEVGSAAGERRVVLMLDALDHLTGRETWIRDLLKELHPNVLFVLSGRAMPEWGDQWPDFMSQVEDCWVEPMKREDMRKLVQRYYGYVRGGAPDPAQVENIINFSRGLPIVVNSAVQLWVKYRVEDFEAIKPKVVADLADLLRRGLPREMYPVVEAAAAVRWFNKDILRELTAKEAIDVDFDELRSFPSVYPRSEGHALHDEVRCFLEENLRLESPERYNSVHERAAQYFERLVSQPRLISSTELERQPLLPERYVVEAIYHRWLLNAESAFTLLSQEISKALTLSHLQYGELLIAEALRHTLSGKYADWVNYWRGELAYRHGAWFESLEILGEVVASHEDQAVLIPAYLTIGKIHYQQGALLRSKTMYEEGLEIVRRTGDTSKQGIMLEYLAKVYRMQGDLKVALRFHEEALFFSQQIEDSYQICSNLGGYGTTLLLSGRLGEGVNYLSQSIDLAQTLGFKLFLSTGLRSRAAGHILLGNLKQAENDAKKSLKIAERLDDIYNIGFASLMLGQVHLERGEAEPAFVSLSGAVESLSKVGARYDLGNAWQLLGAYYQSRGEYGQALEALTSSESILAPLEFRYGLAWVHLRRGGVLEATGDYDSGRAEFEKSISLSREMGSVYVELKALVAAARLELSRGGKEECRRLLGRAEEVSRSTLFHDQAALIHLYEGLLKIDAGDLEAAFDSFWQALIHAINYNCFFFDRVIDEIVKASRQVGPEEEKAFRRKALELVQRWDSAGQQEGLLAKREVSNRLSETGAGLSNIRALLAEPPA